MKTYSIKKIAGLLIVVSFAGIIFSSCKKDFGTINDAWGTSTYTATIPAMYNYIASSMQEAGGLGTAYTSFIFQSTQLAAMYASSGYRLDNVVGGSWDNYYYALSNSYELLDMIAEDENVSKMNNVQAMIKTLMAYKTLKTTCLFSDMPYSEAGKAFYGSENYRPAYDKQQSIFIAALGDLEWAVNNFTTNSDEYSLGNSETLFNGDIPTWIKFANSLRLRYAMIMHDKDASTADAVIADALTKPLLESGDNYGLYPANIANLVFDRIGMYNGNSYIRMGETMFHAMSSTDAKDGSGIYDLRCKILFEPNSAGEWVPYPMNPTDNDISENSNETDATNPYSSIRKTTWAPATDSAWHYAPFNFFYVSDQTFPQLFITSSEINFLKAEIYNRGIGGVGADAALAKQYYETGITESVKFWYGLANGSSVWVVDKPAAEPTSLELSTMLSHPDVAYSTDAATALSQIYKQSWIAFFHEPLEAWNLQRRTGGATPAVTLSPSSTAYNFNRFIYPTSETESNYDNWKAATGGANDQTVKPWFMP